MRLLKLFTLLSPSILLGCTASNYLDYGVSTYCSQSTTARAVARHTINSQLHPKWVVIGGCSGEPMPTELVEYLETSN